MCEWLTKATSTRRLVGEGELARQSAPASKDMPLVDQEGGGFGVWVFHRRDTREP